MFRIMVNYLAISSKSEGCNEIFVKNLTFRQKSNLQSEIEHLVKNITFSRKIEILRKQFSNF